MFVSTAIRANYVIMQVAHAIYQYIIILERPIYECYN